MDHRLGRCLDLRLDGCLVGENLLKGFDEGNTQAVNEVLTIRGPEFKERTGGIGKPLL